MDDAGGDRTRNSGRNECSITNIVHSEQSLRIRASCSSTKPLRSSQVKMSLSGVIIKFRVMAGILLHLALIPLIICRVTADGARRTPDICAQNGLDPDIYHTTVKDRRAGLSD